MKSGSEWHGSECRVEYLALSVEAEGFTSSLPSSPGRGCRAEV